MAPNKKVSMRSSLGQQPDPDQQANDPPKGAGKVQQDSFDSPMITIANEEESSESVDFVNPVSDAGRRYTTQLRWSVAENSAPTQSSLDFYARRRESQSQLSRRSQLAEELAQCEVTRRLATSQISPAVAPNLTKLAPGARSKQRHSLRYPNIGSLDLQGFMGSSSGESDKSDNDESARCTAKKQQKKKSK